jgi:hypothetical protein
MMDTLRSFARRHLPPTIRDTILNFFAQGNWLPRPIYGKATYNADGLLTVHNADFMREPRFARAYAAGRATGSWHGDVFWRAYLLCWAAEHVKRLPGDFVECGVNKGGYSMTVMQYIDFANLPKQFYLLDTFNGLVERQIAPEERAHGINLGDYTECYEEVVATFRHFSNVRLIRGMVPDTLPQVEAEQIAYLHLDMNVREPEIAAAEYFWDKLVSGAVILLDDYGFRKHIEQKKAFDQFAAERGVQILALPTAQGLIFKP